MSGRLDIELTLRGLAPSRERAKSYISNSWVYVNGVMRDKASFRVEDSDVILLADEQKYVSRGGYKLEHAINEFGISAQGKICADIGASTGGFTDCLLRHGAERVYAIDVGSNQLAAVLREDKRVISVENTNARYITPETIGVLADIVTADVSFISLKLILPAVRTLLKSGGEAVCLIKPQFEIGREKLGKRGIVKNPEDHKSVLAAFETYAKDNGFSVSGIIDSPILGGDGNREFLSHMRLL